MKKVLVIEDEPQLRDGIQDILSLEDLYVVAAENGIEGLQLAKEHQPDLIICDIVMPELDGYGVLEQLRQDSATEAIPFIFLTGKADKTEWRYGMEIGADDYLTKPFTASELRQAINSRLQKQTLLHRQSQRELDELRQNIAHALPHEIHTPLTGIIGMAQLLRQQYAQTKEADAIEMLRCIEQSGQRLYRLTQNFLLYADLELAACSPSQVAALRQSDRGCFAEDTVAMAAGYQAERNGREADLRLELQDAWVNIPQPRLGKVVEEVVNNAFKFSEPGSLVRLVSRATQDQFHLFVIDQGRGMTAAQIASIGAYRQFQRKIHEQQGAGLGLIIAQRIVELQGGELTVESFVGQQTIVRITLPGSAIEA